MDSRKLLLGLLSFCAMNIVAQNCDDCYASCDTGCGTPLHCGQWSIVPKIGIAPTRRTKQGCVWLTNVCFDQNHALRAGDTPCQGCNTNPATPSTPVFSVSKTAQFSSQFKMPLAVGFELQYALDNYHMVYLEYAYRHAKNKPFPFTAGAFEVCETTNDFKSNAAYLGARQYYPRFWCDRLSFFAGLKVGILHRNQICYDLNLAVPSFGIPLTAIATNTYFYADNVVSGGVHIGFDYCYNCNWSFQFNVEVVASAGQRTNQNVVFGTSAGLSLPDDAAKLAALGGLSNVNIGAVGTEVQFPITFGLRYNF